MAEKETKKYRFTEEKNKKIIVYSAAILVILSWIPMALTKSLAYDQAYTLAMVRHSFSDIIRLCSMDVHSPLYYFIAKVFYHIFLNQIFGLKICSLFFMALYFYMLAVPFRKEFGCRMAFCMIVLSGSLGTFLTHNTEPRMYTMAIASFSALCLSAYKLQKKFKIKYAVIFFLLSVFCTYIHTYTMLATVLLYLIFAVYICIKKEERKQRIIFFLINSVAVSLLYLPWLFSLLSQFGKKAEGLEGEYDAAFYVKDILYENFSSIMYPKNYQVIIWLCILLAAFIILLIKRGPYIYQSLAGLFIFALVSFIGIFLSVKNSPCFMGRYVTCITPLILFAVSSALDHLKKRVIVLIILLMSCMAGVLVYRDRINYEYDKGIDQYLEFAKENFDEDDALLYVDIHNDALSVYYPEAYSFIYGHKDDFNPYENNEVFTDVSQFDKIKGDVYLICFDNKNPDWFLNCEFEKTYGFHYLYYDVSIYRVYNFQ